MPINPPAYSLSDAVEIVKPLILHPTIFALIYPVGINFSKGIALPNRIVIKSPSPKPGITFKILAKSFVVPPNALDKPSYSVLPVTYPVKPPVSLFGLCTITSPINSQSDISTLPTTRPAIAPVANAVGSFFRASKTSVKVFLNPASTLPKVNNHARRSTTPPSNFPRLETSPLTNV